MNLGMQVSMTETYNIVTADFIAAGIPIITSPEIELVSCVSKTDIKSISNMVSHLDFAHNNSKWIAKLNRYILARNSRRAVRYWKDTLGIFLRSKAEQISYSVAGE